MLGERCKGEIRKNVRGEDRMKGCEMLVSEQDGAIEIMTSQVLWMFSQGLGKTVGLLVTEKPRKKSYYLQLCTH